MAESVRVSDLRERLRAAWDARRSDPAGTVEQAEQLRDLALADGDDAARCQALTIAGAAHVLRNDYPSALRALLEAVSLLDAVDDDQRVRTLSEAGYVDVMLGDHAAGLERLLEALVVAERCGDRNAQASVHNRIGVAFYDHGDLQEARHAYERSLALGTDELVRAGVHNNLAKVLTEQGAYEDALRHLRVARETFAAAGEPRGLAMTFQNAAVVNQQLGEDARVRDQLTTAIRAYDEAGHPHGACEARTVLARHLAGDGADARDDALTLARRAYDDGQRLGLTMTCVAAAEVLVDLYEAHGELREALDTLRRLRAMERSWYDQDSEQRLRSLQVRYQLERLERDNITDALTELLNRRGLDRALGDAVARARHDGTDLAVLMFDLDDFKQVNDRFSHTVGDDVLRRVAGILRDNTRPTDLCARFGGEEFVVVLPDCDLDQARKVADQLRGDIARHDWSTIAAGLQVTSSVGAAVLGQAPDAAALLQASDRALYAAKHAGKDRVR